MKQFINKYLIPKEKKSKSTKPHLDNWNYFWNLGYDTVKELETETGILASGKNELYGAIFGRDSLITSLKLLRVYQKTETPDFLAIVRKVLLTLSELQGREINVESGEEPGKCIHEYRPDNHQHLTGAATKAWYLYPDNIMRNYDTVDATALFLIAVYRYLQASKDEKFLNEITGNVKAALNWIFDYGDSNGDGLIDYQLSPSRLSGGLQNQNWMDSVESTFHEDGGTLAYPIAPVEAQAYTYLALRLWAKHFYSREPQLAKKLKYKAISLKEVFNQKYLLTDGSSIYLASGIDGAGKALASSRSSMGHCLWASLTDQEDGEVDCIVKKEMIAPIVERLMRTDMFEPEAGIRTLSSLSRNFSPNSYHNGSIWPHDSSMIADGFENYGFLDEAELVREALLKAVFHFKTPIELFVYDKTYLDYFSEENGQTSCKMQAWSAAAILGVVSPNYALKFKGNKTLSYRLNSLQAKFLAQSLLKKRLGPWDVISKLRSTRISFPKSIKSD